MRIIKRITRALRGENLPTKERVQHGEFEYGGTGRGEQPVARATDPLRIDRLLSDGFIDEMQHHYGKQIIVWHTCMHRKPSIWDDVRMPNRSTENATIERITAADYYSGTIARLNRRSFEIIRDLCIEELTVRQVCRNQRIRNEDARVYVSQAFDDLGSAIAAMREYFDGIEKTALQTGTGNAM